MDKNIYHNKAMKVMVLCHTPYGNPTDPNGRFYEKGKEYLMTTEPLTPKYHLPLHKKDTNDEDCILCWISFNENYGNRFAVKGNIYHNNIGYWSHFTDIFHCPVELERNNKINTILDERHI